MNVILRKNLGDYRVAYFIFNHGIPAFFEEPAGQQLPSKKTLHNMLDDVMTWHASLLQSILERQEHPDMANSRKLSDLDQTAWQRQRRQRKLEAMHRLAQGSRLAEERDSKKRKFEDMSATEQQVLEDFDTGEARKRHAEACARRLPHFRGKML